MIENPCLLDTDMLSYILKERPPAFQVSREYLKKHKGFTISCLTYYECLRGYKAIGATKRLEKFHSFFIFTEVIYLDRAIFETASDIYAELKKAGKLPGDLDILIAATALVYDLVLVTNNEKHYQPIQDHFSLQIRNWMKQEEMEQSVSNETEEAKENDV
ncbi:MAG: type II toxin-antitoxin system VapC family toxin [Desulfobacterales bacterium]|nr:type II toxin-antitoxin system VapC family toxin [Desulfobacterales bacterium]